MTSGCHFAARAEEDLEEIGDFIARDNPARALSFVRELRVFCRARITDHPRAFRERPELGTGIRAAVFGRYLILFFERAAGGVLIERIVHGSRDLDDRQ